MLAEVFDPRNSKGKRHPLKSILGFLVVGFMCGHKELQSHRQVFAIKPTKSLSQ